MLAPVSGQARRTRFRRRVCCSQKPGAHLPIMVISSSAPKPAVYLCRPRSAADIRFCRRELGSNGVGGLRRGPREGGDDGRGAEEAGQYAAVSGADASRS
jgi:hypothetical protein